MIRNILASNLSNPFRGDRPIWYTFLGAIPCAGILAGYEFATQATRPVVIFDSVLALLVAALLMSMVLVAVTAAAWWCLKQAVRMKTNVAPDTLDTHTPEPDFGVAA